MDGYHHTVDAWIVRRDDTVTALLSNHALPRHSIATERVHILLSETPEPRNVTVERIDEEHANARRAWVEMDRPEYLSPDAIEHLEAASRLAAEPLVWTRGAGVVRTAVDLPPHSVAAVTFELNGRARDG